jgi:hypothetical protein
MNAIRVQRVAVPLYGERESDNECKALWVARALGCRDQLFVAVRCREWLQQSSRRASV